jgi:hypothetical protein
MDLQTRGYKFSINQLFRPKDVSILDESVQYVHRVLSRASLLLKYRLLKSGPASEPLIIDEELVLQATRAVRFVWGDATATTRQHGDDEDAASAGQRQGLLNDWIKDMRELVGSPPPDTSLGTKLSLSHVISIAAKQYVASVLSNVRYHFRQYVCSALGIVLRSKVASITGVRRFEDLPQAEVKRWKREFGKAYDDVLFHRHPNLMTTDARLRPVIERHRRRLVPPLPPRVPSVDRDLDNATRPFVYLGYMVRMVRFVEATGARRLLSPLPLKTSFIPAHYHLDTTCVAQLLMDKAKMKAFRNFFQKSVKGGFPLPGLTNKATLTRSLAFLKGGSVTPVEEELYKDALWTYLCDFKNRRTRVLNPLLHHKARLQDRMRFDHSISTDGISVTMIVSNRETRGRKHLYRSAVQHRPNGGKAKSKPSSEFPDIGQGTPCDVLGEPDPKRRPIFLGADPGKGVLLQLVDTAGRTLRYTSGQRHSDTLARERRAKVLHARCTPTGLSRQLDTSPPCAERLEKEMMRSGLSHKTWNVHKFKRYVAFREEARSIQEATYTRRLFRKLRLLAWMRRRLSVEAFVKKIKEKYGERGTPIVMFYGDWGRCPNLKHQAPTPGIGLRRLIHAADPILTVTVHEAYTSSFCARPTCGGGVSYFRGLHGVLRCDQCGVKWRRDVLGARNILAKGMAWVHGHAA